MEFTFLKSCKATACHGDRLIAHPNWHLTARRLDSHQSHPLESSPSPVLSKFSAPLSLEAAHRSIRSLLCLILNTRTFVVSYSKHLRRILLSSAPPPASVSLHPPHICSPPPAIPEHRKQAHAARAHAHIHACIHTCQRGGERSAECQI